MRLAYFSPMPPARTGIATYSRQLVRALRRHCDVTVFTHTPDAEPIEGVRILDFFSDPSLLKSVTGFDRALYHMGNNPWYHLELLKAFDVFPGAVCLHDLVVYYLAAGLGTGGLLRELLLEDPAHALASLKEIEAQSPEGNVLRYQQASRYPCVQGLLRATAHVIVHNRTSADALRALSYAGTIDVIPLLDYADERVPASAGEIGELRAHLGFGESDLVFGAFGFIGPTKRLDKVLDAMALLRSRCAAERLRLLIVGEGADALDRKLRTLGLQDIVKKAGFVDDAGFQRHLTAIDALVNLRYPSHGESSASLIQAMSHGKPCLVTDDAWFSELPDEAVVKVGFGDTEVDEIAKAMARMLDDPEWARRVGETGRGHILTQHDPDAVASRFVAALEAVPQSLAPAPVPDVPGAAANFSPAEYLAGRGRSLLP